MLFGIIVIWALTAIGLLLVCAIVPGIKAQSTGSLLLAALILGIMNAFIRPLLLLLTWPLTVFSFGLFALLINAFMIQLTAELVPGFEVRDFASALLGSVIMVILAIVGFVFVEWFLFDSVFWLQIGTTRSTLGI